MLTIRVPPLANVHTHLREGEVVGPLIVKAIEGGADVLLPMPNTEKGLTTRKDVLAYVAYAKSCVPENSHVEFLPTFLLNELTDFHHIDECFFAGICDCKVYPLDRTTQSQNGVRNYAKLLPLIRHCAKSGIKCHFHPEHPLLSIGNRDAELAFLAILDMFLQDTEAVIISEHGTDARCISAWLEMAKSLRFFLTLTAHHLAENEDGSFGDVRSTCKPSLKSEVDRAALVDLVTKDYDWVKAGGDDAPHDQSKKHVPKGRCACGAYTAPFLLALYAHALSPLLQTQAGIEIFSRFVSTNARKLHGLPMPTCMVTLEKKPFLIPAVYQIGSWKVQPFWANRSIDWTLVRS